MVNLTKNHDQPVIIMFAVSTFFVLVLMILFIYQQNQIYLLSQQLTANNNIPTPAIEISPTEAISPTIVPTTVFSSPTVAPKIFKAKILDTSTWVSYICGPISYKLPSNYTNKCVVYPDGSGYEIDYSLGTVMSYGTYFNVRSYDGGSRRQYWINRLQTNAADVSKYMRFQETLFGTVNGLDVFGSGGWWQGGGASPILISKGKTIVEIHGGRNFNDETGEILRSEFTDTLASTVKFL